MRRPVVLFRLPYEGRTAAGDRVVHALGILEVLWNVDSRDSLRDTKYLGVARNVIAGLRPGPIVLMYENQGQTIRAVPAIFAALARRRLRAVTVPELISADPSSFDPTPPRSGCPLHIAGGWQRWLAATASVFSHLIEVSSTVTLSGRLRQA